MHRHLHDAQCHARGAKNQVEITKWIKLAEIAPTRGQFEVVATRQDFGPAKCILKPLSEDEGEHYCKEFIPQDVEKTHCLRLHRIHQPTSIDKLSLV